MSAMINKKAKVLLMCKYEDIVICTENLLKYFDYDVQICSNKNQLLSLYQDALTEKDIFTIVIIDLDTLFVSERKELFKNFQKVDPKVKVILIANRVNNLLLDDYKKYGFRDLITRS